MEGVWVLKVGMLVGNSEYEDGGGVIGPAGKAWDGVMVWGTKDSCEGMKWNMLVIEAEFGIRSAGWLKIGRERQGLEADSGRYPAC